MKIWHDVFIKSIEMILRQLKMKDGLSKIAIRINDIFLLELIDFNQDL